MFTNSVTLSQETDRGLAVALDGTVCEDPATDAFAGISLGHGESGDLVAVCSAGESVFCIAGGAISAGQPITFGTDGKVVASTVVNAEYQLGLALEAASGDGDFVRCRILPYYTPSA